MKKSTLMALLCAAVVAPAGAQDLPASTSTDIYDQSPWANDQILELFAKAADEGRNFPTKAEFEALGLTFDLEFVRSHTRLREIYKDAAADVVADINHDRRLWCNTPGGFGKNTGGYPSSTFDQDVFSMWNYTHLYGSWNYSILTAPGAWVDAAHRNGTRIYSGIKFFESWNNEGEAQAFVKFVSTKKDDGTYKYADALVNACTFFGNDGINYNTESGIYSDADWVAFHKAANKSAKDRGLNNFGIGQYTNVNNLSANNIDKLYGTTENGQTFDCMLNYSGNKLAYRGLSTTVASVNNYYDGNFDNVYQGEWQVTLANDYWTEFNTGDAKKINLCLWGEHDIARWFQFRVGTSPTNIQENYQVLLEKVFSGYNRNPLNRPTIKNSGIGSYQVAGPENIDEQLSDFFGMASMFPERTTVGGKLPFNTYFCLGNGENYFYKGKVTHGSWYNMSQQDLVPTYRWLVTAKGDMKTYANDIDVRFTHEDAYIGGSSIRLSGATTAGNDIVLYRTNLTVGAGSPVATLALKNFKEGTSASCLSLIIRKKGSDNWIEVPCGDLTGAAWNVKELPVAGLAANDVVEYIGLRVNGSDADYKMLVGQLKLSDGVCSGDFAKIEKNSLKVEIKEETPLSLSVKMNWAPDYTGFTTSYDQFGNVFNDEINVDHFEIMYKESAEAPVKELGRTSQWATYIGNIPMDQTANAYIGVRSVSTDLKCCSPIEWVEIPRYTGTLPEVVAEDPYGKSWMSDNGNGTQENNVKNIYVEKVTTTGATQDLNYYVTSNPLQGNSTEQYYYAADHKLILNQGQKVSMLVKGFNSGTGESLKYDFVLAYIDYDGNYSFLDADENLGKFGNMNAGTEAIVTPGITIEFTVPEDAHIGESRLRIVGCDAWSAHPGPTGGTVKGYSIDFPVEIQGTNPDRGPAKTYKDFRDQGEPEQPEFLEGFSGIEEVAGNAAVSGVEVVGSTAYFTNVEKAWFFDVAGRMVKFVNDGAESVSIADFANGVYVVKMEYNNVIRSQKVVKK